MNFKNNKSAIRVRIKMIFSSIDYYWNYLRKFMAQQVTIQKLVVLDSQIFGLVNGIFLTSAKMKHYACHLIFLQYLGIIASIKIFVAI